MGSALTYVPKTDGEGDENIHSNNAEETWRNDVVIVYSDKNVEFRETQTDPRDVKYSPECILADYRSIKAHINFDEYTDMLPGWVEIKFSVQWKHINLVNELWQTIRTGTKAFLRQNAYTSPIGFFCAEFYERLFDRLPETRKLFQKSRINTQGNELVRMISSMVSMLTSTEDLQRTLHLLAERHIQYGANKPVYFANFCEVLLDTLMFCGGEVWGEEYEVAWKKVLSLFMVNIIPVLVDGHCHSLDGSDSQIPGLSRCPIHGGALGNKEPNTPRCPVGRYLAASKGDIPPAADHPAQDQCPLRSQRGREAAKHTGDLVAEDKKVFSDV